MFEENNSDLHCHLNGSFSLGFLRSLAEKYGKTAVFERYKILREEYLAGSHEQPAQGYSHETISKIWILFGLIHQLVLCPEDIELGTLDVVNTSTARYLEVRTTPKALGTHSRDDYIQAFAAGLYRAANANRGQKIAYGLLSLDRTQHTLADAMDFMQHIQKSPHQMLVGLDVCGNPAAARSLRGEDMAKLVSLALENNIKLAIHMGETDTEQERQDTNAVLDALENWQAKQSDTKNPSFIGKIRLGHCIFLTEQQKMRVRRLNLPIEVCPTCHKKLNWHIESKPHPVSAVYPDVSEGIVVGTDDEAVFGGKIKEEQQQLLGFFTNHKNMSKKEIKAHQAQFRFVTKSSLTM